jgi:hypothetical protein
MRQSPQRRERACYVTCRQDIQEIRAMLGGIKGSLDRTVAQCEVCRHIVMGNGQEPLAVRVARIEEDKRIGGWLVTKIIALAGVVATVFGSVASLTLKYVTGK